MRQRLAIRAGRDYDPVMMIASQSAAAAIASGPTDALERIGGMMDIFEEARIVRDWLELEPRTLS